MLGPVLFALLIALSVAAPAHGQSNAEAAREEVLEGARLYRDGLYAEAERRFRRALSLDPSGKHTRLFIARAVQRQYKPGDSSPENVAQGERAIAAYAEVLGDELNGDDAYKATVFLYGQLGRDDKVVEMLERRAGDASVSGERRAEAYVILASRRWQCSYDVTERKENKTAESRSGGILIRYRMPARRADFVMARRCADEGLRLSERALALDPASPVAWSYKANLLREQAKLAEMRGARRLGDAYNRRYAEALGEQKRLSARRAGEN